MGEPLRIVVSGASSGIGAALVEALWADGHRLFVCARNQQIPKKDRSPRVVGRVCDVSDEKQVVQFIDWIKEHTLQIDALINCAGVMRAIGPVTETDTSEWLETIRVNLFGTYLMCKHAIPLMDRSPAPRIINFSGGGAFNPFPNYSAYACSKAGVIRLTECLAMELAPLRVRVNAVAPGFIATAIHQGTLDAGPQRAGREQYELTLKRLQAGTSLQPAIECVRFLLSAQADPLTGKTISANFDPWREPAFLENIGLITNSDLFTMRRVTSSLEIPPRLARMFERSEDPPP